MKKFLSILALSSVFTLSGTAFAQSIDTGSESAFSGQVSSGEVASLPMVPQTEEDVIGIGAASPAPGIKLSDEQLEKIHALKNSFKDSASKKVLDLKTLKRQLKDTVMAEKVDRAKATAIQAKINELKNELSSAKLAMRLDTLEILTPEQKQQMRHRQLQKEAFGGRGGRHGGKRMHHRRAPIQKQAQT